MKSVQRKFGTLMKRSDNEKDVQTVLEEFKAVDDMLERVRVTPSRQTRVFLTNPTVTQGLQSMAHCMGRHLEAPVRCL
jgi:hypothetical protein